MSLPEERAVVADLKRYRRIIIWGLRRQFDTMRYIHNHYYHSLKKLGLPVYWVDNAEKNQHLIEAGDLVYASNMAWDHLPILDDVDYCLHNLSDEEMARFNPSRSLRLQVYTNDAEAVGGEHWNEVTVFDKKNRVLYQPWGTDLLAHEFKKPVFPKTKRVFWVGSIWDNEEGQGNQGAIEELRTAISKHGLKFKQLQKVPNFVNVGAVRRSRIAPAIAGAWQAEKNYLPCRMFKNISYGQLGLSNVKRFDDLYQDAFLKGDTMAELVDNALGLSEKEFKELVRAQQLKTTEHTYAHKAANIARALELIR